MKLDDDIIREACLHFAGHLEEKLRVNDYNEPRNYQIDKMKLRKAIEIANGGGEDERSK